ncbi:MAG: ACT domain-containing protein [Parvibaculaceae bacterium]
MIADKAPEVVRDTQAMLAGMTPRLTAGEYVFCTTADAGLAARAGAKAFGFFREDEGMTLILARDDARALGFDDALPMRRIVLEVYSALDGIGLTAGVATALGVANIPCNMVAGYHHDHVFVPAALADQAQAVLAEIAARARAG